MKFKLRLDGIDFETDNEQLAQAVRKQIERADKAEGERDAALAQVAEHKTRADKAEAERDQAVERHDAAMAPDAVRARVDARLGLERAATAAIGDEKATDLKLDTLDDLQLKKAVVVALQPSAQEKLDADDCTEAYVDARFDAALELAQKSDTRDDGGDDQKPKYTRNDDDQKVTRTDSESARLRMLQGHVDRGTARLPSDKRPN